MANKVFISFRFSDGNEIKEALVTKFEELDYTINKSENENRSGMSDETIQKYLYEKLKDTSITVVLITPQAVNHTHNYEGTLDDWMYDEIRYSLEDRTGNRTNVLIIVYTKDAKSLVIDSETDDLIVVSDFDNLVRKNMMNVKSDKKVCPDEGRYDLLLDSYASLISYDLFLSNPQKHIDNAIEKRNRKDDFNLVKRMS